MEKILFPNVLVFFRQDDKNVRTAGNQIQMKEKAQTPSMASKYCDGQPEDNRIFYWMINIEPKSILKINFNPVAFLNQRLTKFAQNIFIFFHTSALLDFFSSKVETIRCYSN